jgi:hypothetical protein
MMKRFFSIRIPSYLGILLLLVGVGVTSYLVDRGVIFESRAAPDNTPANLTITNVTPTGFTVMYTTQESVPGSLMYGTEPTNTDVALDDRDSESGRISDQTIHHISVNNLSPDTTYYFSIVSGDEVIQNNSEPFEVTTAPELDEDIPDYPAITGTVRFSDTDPKTDLLVLATPPDSQPLSAIVDPDGSYTISLAELRNNDLSGYAELTDESVMNITILSQDRSSKVKVVLGNAGPVPLVLFGQSYDFTLSVHALSSDTASDSAETLFPETTASSDDNHEIAIVSPEDDETFTDQQPLFTGTAIPGEEIEIIIRSDPQLSTVLADDIGSWEYRPEEPLTPGEHTITIKTRDITGTLREFTRSFTVYAQGSQFIEPSISPTRAPTPTLVLTDDTPTPTLQPTATPTLQPTMTTVPTTVVSAAPSPTRQPLPPTGSGDTLIGGILGAGTLVIGFVLFFLTRGSSL